jgi:hypothetical protein
MARGFMLQHCFAPPAAKRGKVRSGQVRSGEPKPGQVHRDVCPRHTYCTQHTYVNPRQGRSVDDGETGGRHLSASFSPSPFHSISPSAGCCRQKKFMLLAQTAVAWLLTQVCSPNFDFRYYLVFPEQFWHTIPLPLPIPIPHIPLPIPIPHTHAVPYHNPPYS